jgi:hypothetical protein
VSIFHFDGASWVFMQKLLDPDGAINDAFGSSVAISGEKLIVGAPFDNGTFTDQGSATIFHFNGTEWEYITKLLDSSANENDRFGHSVAIDGNTAIVGSVFYDVNGDADEGSVLVFDFDGNTWSFIARLTDPNGTAYDYLGTSVSISGDYVIAGAKGDDDNRGAALIFKKYNQTWGHYKRVYSQGAGSSTYFGASVGISGDNLLIGANGYSYTGCNGCGSAVLYQRVETVWQRYQQINDPGGAVSDQMGISVAIDGITRRFIIGAFGTDGFKGKVLLGKIN